MKEWTLTTLKEVTQKIQYGYTASATNINTGVKLVRITDITQSHINWNDVPFCEISEIDIKKYKLKVNDIVIARTGATVGYAKQIKRNTPKAVFASYLIRVNIKDNVDSTYLGTLVESSIYKYYVKTIAGGAAQPNANVKDLTSFPFFLPPLPIQKKIAAILCAYDELIENNNRRIAILERMVEEIYREWFVRMRFPGHEKVKFKKRVPEGWEVVKLKSFGNIITGKTPSTLIIEYYNGPYLFIKTPDMHGKMFVLKTEETLSQGGLESQSKQTLPKDSICVNCIGALSGSVSITIKVCQTNQQIHSIVLNDNNCRGFLFWCIKGLKETIHLFGNTGSTMTNLSKGKFENLRILKPMNNLIAEYHRIVMPIFENIKVLCEKNISIKQSRDLLLPRLISGKLDVEKLDIAFPPGMNNTDLTEGKEAEAA